MVFQRLIEEYRNYLASTRTYTASIVEYNLCEKLVQ